MVVDAINPSDTNFPGDEIGTVISIDPGDYSVSEVPDLTYKVSFSSDCSGTAGAGKVIKCTITNDDKKKPTEERWDTRPTFGMNHETRDSSTPKVENGFSYNGKYFSITDNDHTPFGLQPVNIGIDTTFTATVYASKGLKVQEFLFGVPEVGLGNQAEVRVEV